MKDFFDPKILASDIAIVGKKGAGKTSTIKAMIEQIVQIGEHVCVLDPIKSDYWGMTSSADGKSPGLPFRILGGPYGEIALPSSAGAAVAEIVADGSLPLSIIDMANFEPGGLQRFFIAFSEALFQRNRGVLHLIIEEAHEFAPKERMGIGNENMALHWAKKLSTGGRTKGIRLIVATQRTQALHNAVLGGCETMIAHRLTAPADKEPVVKWFKANATTAEMRTVDAEIANLKTGSAFLYSGEMGLFEKIVVPRIHTYDNTKTPDGTQIIKAVRAPVNADALRILIGKAAEEADANDPKKLRDEIARLKKEVAAKPASLPAKDGEFERGYEAAWEQAGPEIDGAASHGFREGFVAGARKAVEEMHVRLRLASDDKWIDKALEDVEGGFKPTSGRQRQAPAPIRQIAAPILPTRPKAAIAPLSGDSGSDKPLKAERAPLAALASVYPAGMTEAQWAVAAGLKRTGGTFQTYVSRLRSAGRIEKADNLYFATTQGIADLGDRIAIMPSPGPELVEFWANKISGAAKMLRFLAEHRNWISRSDLAEAMQMAESGGTFGTYLSRLRAPGLIEINGRSVRVSPNLIGVA